MKRTFTVPFTCRRCGYRTVAKPTVQPGIAKRGDTMAFPFLCLCPWPGNEHIRTRRVS